MPYYHDMARGGPIKCPYCASVMGIMDDCVVVDGVASVKYGRNGTQAHITTNLTIITPLSYPHRSPVSILTDRYRIIITAIASSSIMHLNINITHL